MAVVGPAHLPVDAQKQQLLSRKEFYQMPNEFAGPDLSFIRIAPAGGPFGGLWTLGSGAMITLVTSCHAPD
ncbi:MAG: hypothetical protein WCB11_18535 [Terriglobales bacterium]